jgi:hypothetical protein
MSRLMWSLRGRGLLVAVALLGSSASLEAQNRRTVLTVTGLPLTVTGTTVADFDAGSVSVGTMNFSVDLTTNAGGAFPTRVTAVQVRCGATCTGNFGRLQWRRNDLGVWNTLTTTYATIETRTATFNGVNDPWNNSILFRYQLAYATDAPSAATQYTLQIQLVVTAP